MSAVKNLLDLLELEHIGNDRYIASAKEYGWKRIFGGLIVAQAIVAAYKTIDNKYLHSLHSYFLRAGDPDIPIEYDVEKLRDGRSFGQRVISAYQNNHLIFYMITSFHKDETGLSHQLDFPGDIKNPNELSSEIEILDEIFKKSPANIKDTRDRERPIEFRPLSPRNMVNPKEEPPEQLLWLRLSEKANTDRILNQALLAYASDYTILDTALMPHGISIFQRNIQVASLDHSMWFHRDFDINQWILYNQNSPNTFGNRGFAQGIMYSQEGKLLASVSQEGMIRLLPNN